MRKERRNVSVSYLATVKEKLAPSRLFQLRSRMDIMVCILNEAIKGARKTHLMYRCNLSNSQVQAYLKLLLGMGMLKLASRNGSKTADFLKTSAKGYNFLNAYHKLKTLMA